MNDRNDDVLTMNREMAATYRIQMRSGVGFAQAADLAPYLTALGISHCYASPFLQAGQASTHGYDIVDPTRVDRSLGGDAAHRRFCLALQSCGLAQMIDLVPNHMAIADRENRWWWDVLENGPDSRFAAFFDVDWRSAGADRPSQVMLPVLGDHYGRVLENGDIFLFHSHGDFEIHCHGRPFPVNPKSLSSLLGQAAASSGSGLLAFLAQSCTATQAPLEPEPEPESPCRFNAEFRRLLRRLCREEPETAAAIDQEVARINADADALDALIARQHFRPAFWRSAAGRLGYRRFFDINDLIGLRVEVQAVFAATHRLPIGWVRDGWVHGLRIDHPDGLWDPTAYFQQLRRACPNTWIVAEKILEPGEALAPQWPIDGTTGYDFLNRAAGLFVDPWGLKALTPIYEDFYPEAADYATTVRQSKGVVLQELFSSELNRLTALLAEICERHRRHRDYTRHELREALYETLLCFPVYRTYVQADRDAVAPTDRGYVQHAIAEAAQRRPDLDRRLFDFLEALLLLQVSGSQAGQLAMRFQQLTGPVMAKGVEDTAFYRFHRLVCCNEVGGDPDHYPVSPQQFHQACARTLAHHPRTLLATSTHDTKRSEDMRARLAVLSEIPAHWAEAGRRWAKRNQRHRRGDAPDPNTEYLFYQTLVGAWPIDSKRITAYMHKAAREAKIRTSWNRPNADYEEQLTDFIGRVMQDDDFCADLEYFTAALVAPGRINSLAQTLLKLTAPGVPDIYQGTELWDLSLVDPDNRRPVNFALREQLLAQVQHLRIEAIMARMDEGLPKLWLLRQGLHLRRRRPALFGPQGAYDPLLAQGPKADHVVAYLRGQNALTIVPRLTLKLGGLWADTALALPTGHWRNVLTDETMPGGNTPLDRLLARFPVALLIRQE